MLENLDKALSIEWIEPDTQFCRGMANHFIAFVAQRHEQGFIDFKIQPITQPVDRDEILARLVNCAIVFLSFSQRDFGFLSGGNIDVTILSRVIKRGLLKSGRTYSLTIELLDKPGQLKGVADIIAKEGGNVISIHHERASEGSDINGCYLRIVLETKNFDHIAQIKKALTDAGFIIKSY